MEAWRNKNSAPYAQPSGSRGKKPGTDVKKKVRLSLAEGSSFVSWPLELPYTFMTTGSSFLIPSRSKRFVPGNPEAIWKHLCTHESTIKGTCHRCIDYITTYIAKSIGTPCGPPPRRVCQLFPRQGRCPAMAASDQSF